MASTRDNPNPFHILQLPISATNEEIVERRRELETGAEPAEQMLYRWATEELITHPLTHLEHQLFEMPDTRYEDPLIDRFVRAFKRYQARSTASAAAPELADTDIEAIFQQLLAILLTIPEGDLRVAIDNPPFALRQSLPLGVRDVIF